MTQSPSEDIILEPGDPGYVPPGDQPEGVPIQQAPVPPEQGGPAPAAEPPAPPEDLRPTTGMELEFAEVMQLMHTVVRSENPSDIVPNMPQITMGGPPPEAESQAVHEALEAVRDALAELKQALMDLAAAQAQAVQQPVEETPTGEVTVEEEPASEQPASTPA